MIYVPHCPTPVRSITSEREGPLTCDLAMLTFDKLQKKCPDQTQRFLQESTATKVTKVAKTETSLAFDSNYIA